MQSWTVVPGAHLSGEHIGRMVRLRTWDHTTEIAVIHTGEMRQVGHTGNEVYLHIGVGAAMEVALNPDQPITLDPPHDYADVAELARYDERV